MVDPDSDLARQLETKLLQAHSENDRLALINLYTQAADLREASGDVDATCFFLTHAYIYALELGVYQANELNQRLVAYGREVSMS